MPSHEEKFLTKVLIGFGSIIGGVMIIFYATFERIKKEDDWYFWGILSATLIAGGIYVMLSGFVNKVKADFSRKQRIHKQQRTEPD
jgi:hypothetical protein